MKIGMLWFDNDPKSDLATKVERAAAYYQNKYGKKANTCFIHPSMASVSADAPAVYNGVAIKTSRKIMPNHFWVGVSDV